MGGSCESHIACDLRIYDVAHISKLHMCMINDWVQNTIRGAVHNCVH